MTRRRRQYAGWPVLERNTLALAVLVLALWLLLNSTGKPLSETWDVIFAIVAGLLAALALRR